jgi:hypothetical protein
MSSAVARKVAELVHAGATVVGTKPSRTVGLRDKGQPEVGGIATQPLDAVLKGSAPDFRCDLPGISFIHRRIDGADAYFVASMARVATEQRCFFRVVDRKPELWHAENGQREDAPVWRPVAGGVEVTLRLGPAGSVFVVFRDKTAGGDHVVGVQADIPEKPGVPVPKVIKAEYGVLADSDKTKDVTARVAESIAAFGEVQATNDNLGGDPAVNIVKALRVTYSEGGTEHTVTVPENDTLRLGGGEPAPVPDYELQEKDGRALLRAWKSGKYDVRMASGASSSIDAVVADPVELPGPWEVRFPAGWDAPTSASFDKLISWTDSADFGTKYFSGTATYTKTFTVASELTGDGTKLILDLGAVREISQVRLNGKDLGVRWWAPYRYDITDAVKPGENSLEVRVTNLWVNRLIGDEQFPDDIGWQGETFGKWPEWFVKGTPRPEPRRKTFTTWRHNYKDTPLMPSGLLGPVKLRVVKVYPVTH